MSQTFNGNIVLTNDESVVVDNHDQPIVSGDTDNWVSPDEIVMSSNASSHMYNLNNSNLHYITAQRQVRHI